jgi:hypothetical protein
MKRSSTRAATSVVLTLLLLCPAWAAGGDSISDLKKQIQELLLVESDPDTPAELRQLNRTFIAQRRAELRKALAGRVNALRNYRAKYETALKPAELRVIDDSVARLEGELNSLDAVAAAPDAGEARRAAAGAPAAARARRGRRGAAESAARPVPRDASAEVMPARAVVVQARADAAAGTAAEPVATAAQPSATPAFRFNAPAGGRAEVAVKEYEVAFEAADPTAIDAVMVSAYNPPDETKMPYAARLHTFKPSEKGKWSEVVELRRGDNLIVVNDTKDSSRRATATIRYTLRDADRPPLGSTASAAASEESATVATDPNIPGPVLDTLKEDAKSVRGKLAASPAPDDEVEIEIDGVKMDTRARVFDDATFSYTNPRLILRGGQVVAARVVRGDKASRFTEKTVLFEGEERSPLEGAPTGLVFGGAVISQQAQEFQQSDPFFGFIAGYRFGVFRPRPVYNFRRVKRDGRTLYYLSDLSAECKLPDARNTDPVRDKDKLCPRLLDGERKPVFAHAGRIHLRFQGIFTASPRAARPMDTAESPAPTPGTGDPTDFQPFVTSRKTFDSEMHAWYDRPVTRAGDFFVGPYGAIGFSTILDKNELIGEKIPVERTMVDGNEGSNPDNPPVDGSQVQTDNDVKRYWEVGLHLSSLLFSRKVFLENILAYGNYEAMEGLYEGANTKHRFIGKLRIFPSGVNTTAGRQIQMAPMFGVDLNAGRGPDQVRFFTGFAVRIKGLSQ